MSVCHISQAGHRTPRGRRAPGKAVLAAVAALGLAGCDGGFDWDMRAPGSGASTAEAARQATAARPMPDARGVISYPGYQVAVARRGDTVSSVAERVGISPGELARYNALTATDALRDGEVLALPMRVAEPSPATGMRPATGGIDVSTIASLAIDRADAQTAAGSPTPAGTRGPDPERASGPSGPEPIRHQVVRGETAFSIARLYNVSTRALAEWNGLGSDMIVREGQYLLIPVAASGANATQTAASAPPPGTGSPTPTPPSAARPLPSESPGTQAAAAPPASPDLGAQASSATRLAMPVDGRVIREFNKGRNDGIGLAAPAGTAVRAADEGTVAAINRDAGEGPIMVIRHSGNLLTVYAGIDDVRVERGATVRRGQTIAAVRAGEPSFLHFEVREGFESVDPMRYLQ